MLHRELVFVSLACCLATLLLILAFRVQGNANAPPTVLCQYDSALYWIALEPSPILIRRYEAVPGLRALFARAEDNTLVVWHRFYRRRLAIANLECRQARVVLGEGKSLSARLLPTADGKSSSPPAWITYGVL